MELEWQAIDPAKGHLDPWWPYLWCHYCSSPKQSGIAIGKDNKTNARMCLECLDKINSFAMFYANPARSN